MAKESFCEHGDGMRKTFGRNKRRTTSTRWYSWMGDPIEIMETWFYYSPNLFFKLNLTGKNTRKKKEHLIVLRVALCMSGFGELSVLVLFPFSFFYATKVLKRKSLLFRQVLQHSVCPTTLVNDFWLCLAIRLWGCSYGQRKTVVCSFCNLKQYGVEHVSAVLPTIESAHIFF